MDNRKRRNQVPLVLDTTLGKIPPQSVDTEAKIIGACFNSEESLHKAISIMAADAFYKHSHQLIYKAMCELVELGSPVDLMTVAHKLRQSGQIEEVGGVPFMATLSSTSASTHQTEYHCRIVQEQYIKRKIIESSLSLYSRAYEDGEDCFELLEQAQNILTEATNQISLKQATNGQQRFQGAITRINDAMRTGVSPGMTTGIPTVDRFFGGLHPGGLYCIGARPGNGKTAAMMTIAHRLSQNGIPSLYLNMEMEQNDAANRELAMYSGVPINVIHRATLGGDDYKNVVRAKEDLEKSKVYIDFDSRLDVLQVKGKLLSAIRQYGVRVLFLDYLQIMNHHDKDHGTRDIAIGHTTGMLKAIAKDLGVPIVFGSQLGRATENQDFGRPKIQHLRESGNIEQDCDWVGFLWNPSNYEKLLEGHPDYPPHEIQDLLVGIVAKHRQGAIGDEFKMTWYKDINVITERNGTRSQTKADFEGEPF